MSKKTCIIEGHGLRLRPFAEKDVPVKVRWINDPEVHRFLHYGLPLEIEKTQNWFNRINDRTERYDLVIESPPGRPVGLIGLLNIDLRHKTAEFYIAIGEKMCWGKGVGKKSTSLLCKWAFDEIGLYKLWANIRVENQAMIAMMEKVGFQNEGFFRKERCVNDSRVDIIHVGLLRDEFIEQTGQE